MKKQRTPKAPKPKWTVTTRETSKPIPDSIRFEKTTTHSLRYEGRKVHSLTGENGLAALTETASRYNDEGYAPALSGTKLLFELSSSKRRELDDQWAKSVPDLFAVESEVKP